MAYLCCKDKATKWSNCDNKKYIKETELHKIVLSEINNILNKFYNEDTLLEINNAMIEKELFHEKIISLNKEELTITKELKSKDTYLQNLYEDMKKGLLNQKEYINLRKKYKEDYSRLEERIEKIQQEIKDIQVKQEKLKDKKALFKKYKHIDSLNTHIVNDFIDKIFIGKLDEKTNKRNIHIVWNFTN